LFIFRNCIIKERITKGYRLRELDDKISTSRTKNELRMYKTLRNIVNVPKIFEGKIEGLADDINWKKTIVMEKIDGVVVKDIVEKNKCVLKEVGNVVRKMHDCDVIHGDLTTSNFIFANDNHDPDDVRDSKTVFENKIFVIDFGLSFKSSKVEDKAVDLYVLAKAIVCAHGDEYVDCFYEGYGDDKRVLERLKQVRNRGRKKSMVG
ncbi:EKC/KEOPS complex subunit BUD32, partial [Dictyocoela roeselum]